MIATVVIAAAAAAPAVESSPLAEQAEAIASSPSPVRWEFARQVFTNFSMTQSSFGHLPVEQQRTIALKAYWLRALSKAYLLQRGDADLVAILNRFTVESDDHAEEIALAFERTYRAKFGGWPPMVPVDVDALIARMLGQQTVR